MLPAVSWVHMGKESSSMSILWRIAYSNRIPRANQDDQNPPPRQSTQKPQQK